MLIELLYVHVHALVDLNIRNLLYRHTDLYMGKCSTFLVSRLSPPIFVTNGQFRINAYIQKNLPVDMSRWARSVELGICYLSNFKNRVVCFINSYIHVYMHTCVQIAVSPE